MADTVPPLFVFVRLHARVGCESEIADAIAEVVKASRREPGCARMNGFRSTRDLRLFLIHSVWKDESAFEVHAGLPHTLAFMETIDRLLEAPREVTRTIEIV